MGLRYLHLDEPDVREAMVLLWSGEWSELVDRPDRGECYGRALTPAGWDAFADTMPVALDRHDDDWLMPRWTALSTGWPSCLDAYAVARGGRHTP